MLYLVTTTGRCNLKCSYCGGSFDEKLVPYSVKYDIENLVKIIEKDENTTVVYYGGEPLLNPSFIVDLNSRIRGRRIGIQTNGTLVKNFPPEFWKDFSFALISIDGISEITEKNRGKGVYSKVIESAKYLKSLGLETIARMTVTEETDIFRDVMHLYNLNLFDRIHWQLDVVWERRWDLKNYAKNTYIPGIEKLMNEFTKNLKIGRIMGIVPFLGILSSYFFKHYNHFPCGAGQRSITVNTDGKILACPIAPEYEWNQLGDLNSFKKIETPQCNNCKYFGYCGGRCLFSYIERYWGEEGFREICDVTMRTIDIVLEKVNLIEDLIGKGVIKKESLKYDPVLDSTEVIP